MNRYGGIRQIARDTSYCRLGVVVPVHDEESSLQECLDSLAAATSVIELPVSVMIVLDACTDRSAEILHQSTNSTVHGMTVDHACVGAARRAGMAELLHRLGTGGTWLATTDADSRVPRHWLSAQLRHARRGARMVAGTVSVDDWAGRSRTVREQAERAYRRGPHRHVHGANLSFSASAYVRAGGFQPIPCHEDVELVAAMQSNRERIKWATDLSVVTSARRSARAPTGFAHYLTSLEDSRSDTPA